MISKKGQIIQNALDGYDILKNKASLSNLDNIKYELLKVDLLFDNLYFSNFLFSKNLPSVNIISKQLLFSTLIDINFNLEYLSSIKLNSKIAYPLPKKWQNVLIKQNVKISTFKCSLLWYIFLIKCWINGIKSIFKICINSIDSILTKNNSFIDKYTYCFDLNELALEYDCENKKSFMFLNWYSRYKESDSNLMLFHNVSSVKIKNINHNIIIKYNNNYLPYFINFKQLFYFFFFSLYLSIQSFFKFIFGKWENLLLFNETIKYLQVKLSYNNFLADDYLFNNSIGIYKPLWTYEAERKGSNVIYYYYSIPSFYKLYSNSINNFLVESFSCQTWNNYYVWNHYQEDFIKSIVKVIPKYLITGPLIFGKPARNLFNEKKSIVIFDIQSFVDTKYKLLCNSEEYYIPEIAIQFLSDIKELTNILNLKIYYKRKRNIDNQIHPKLLNYINNDFIDNNNIIQIDPDFSPYDIICKTNGSISMPFTSTAFIGSHLNKPSVFYDSTMKINKLNNNAGKILILSGPEELKTWLTNL